MGQSEKASQKTQAAVSPEGWQDFLGGKEGEVHYRQTREIVTMSCSREHIPLFPVGFSLISCFHFFLIPSLALPSQLMTLPQSRGNKPSVKTWLPITKCLNLLCLFVPSPAPPGLNWVIFLQQCLGFCSYWNTPITCFISYLL